MNFFLNHKVIKPLYRILNKFFIQIPMDSPITIAIPVLALILSHIFTLMPINQTAGTFIISFDLMLILNLFNFSFILHMNIPNLLL